MGVCFVEAVASSCSTGVRDRLERLLLGDLFCNGDAVSLAANLLFRSRDPIVSPASLDSASDFAIVSQVRA